MSWPVASCIVTRGKQEGVGVVLVSMKVCWRKGVENPLSASVVSNKL